MDRMRPRMRVCIGLVCLTLVTLLALVAVAWASAAGYTLAWWPVDGSGSTDNRGGSHTLGGTIGHPDPGLLTGGDYTLGGGFWGGGAQRVSQSIYLPPVPKAFP